jgi:hypothetical protein
MRKCCRKTLSASTVTAQFFEIYRSENFQFRFAVGSGEGKEDVMKFTAAQIVKR